MLGANLNEKMWKLLRFLLMLLLVRIEMFTDNEKDNGVHHKQKMHSFTKNLTKKKLGSSHKVKFFISKKSSMISKFTHKIKTVSKFHTQFTYYGYISNN